MSSSPLVHRAPLLWIALPLMAGLALGRSFDVGGVILPLTLATLGLIGCRRSAPAWLWAFGIALALTAAGATSVRLHLQRPAAWDDLPPREGRAVVHIERVFSATDPRKASGIGRIIRGEGALSELVGQRVYFACRLRDHEPLPERSAELLIAGVLTSVPRHPSPASFEGYLASAGVNFRLTRGHVVREEKPALAYYRFCARASARFNAILGLGIARKRPALAGLLRAMMLGETRELTEEQHTIFMQSGTMHLFAISGLNIGVIATALQALLGLARVPAWGRFALGVPLLWLFVDITGAAPSAVRAFAMAVFFQGAFVLRRPSNPFAALVGSAVLVLVISPLQLFSASFLMSYAIVAALLVLGLPLGERWAERTALWRDLPKVTWSWWQDWAATRWRELVLALGIGVATAAVGTITGIEYFQLFTPGALVANLVLIPTAVLVTLGGFVALLCGLVGCTFGAVLCNHAAALVLLVIENLVRWSVRVPGAFLPAEFRAPWIGGTVLALVLASLLWGYATQWKLSCGGWWPPFAVVGLTLLLGVRFG